MNIKIVKIFLLIFLINIIFSNINIAKASGVDNIFGGGDTFIQSGQLAKNQIGELNEDELKNTSSIIYNILLVAGICIAAIVSVILGIQFMLGSIEQKAKIKEALIPFIIGCVVIFGAFGIWKILTEALSYIPGIF